MRDRPAGFSPKTNVRVFVLVSAFLLASSREAKNHLYVKQQTMSPGTPSFRGPESSNKISSLAFNAVVSPRSLTKEEKFIPSKRVSHNKPLGFAKEMFDIGTAIKTDSFSNAGYKLQIETHGSSRWINEPWIYKTRNQSNSFNSTRNLWRSNLSHYGDPANGCRSDEKSISLQGVPGDLCVPHCTADSKCPTDVPKGVTAAPQCAIGGSGTSASCALICKPSLFGDVSDAQCGGAICSLQGCGQRYRYLHL
jgi:hypothetical protein